ncbi:MAG: type IV toxin-antitoxin system AbiEi family antitoxin domain-containing protein [Raoultibacter sp.]
MNEIVTNIDALREIALEQYGYVSTAQALDAGVTQASLSMLVKRKRLERACYGVYRVLQIPSSHFDRFMLAVLWTGVSEAVLSHETALDMYEVCDINPTTIHLTVARHRRIKRTQGEGYLLHYQNLQPDQIGWWEGVPTVTLPCALEQCIASGVPSYLIKQAIDRGSKRGMLVAEEPAWLRQLLEKRDRHDG